MNNEIVGSGATTAVRSKGELVLQSIEYFESAKINGKSARTKASKR